MQRSRRILVFCLSVAMWGCKNHDDHESGQSFHLLSELDADGNGLYDDGERKAMLDVFLQECPDLQTVLNKNTAAISKASSDYQEDFSDNTAPTDDAAQSEKNVSFDANGDGKVTILEQTVGRPPLSLLVPKTILASDQKIPWALDIFPEWLSSAYFQEDVAPGAVAKHSPRGTVRLEAAQESAGVQPNLLEPGNGVTFAANSGQFLKMPGRRDAPWDYRWCLFTFRIDGNSGAGDQTILLDLNRGKSSNYSSPKIWFHKESGLNIRYVGLNEGGLDERLMTTKDIVADGETWNVLVCGIRYGQMVASVNGRPLSTASEQLPRFSGEWLRDSFSYLGDENNRGNMEWAYDSLVFGLTEPSEAMVRKMTGWAAHRLGFAENLPEDHPHRTVRPVLDAEDFPDRYNHNDKVWNAWGQMTKDKSVTRVNAGGPRVEIEGFERVFLDDFRANRTAASTSGAGDLWLGPGFNIAVGGDAQVLTPGDSPNAYPHDAEDKKQIVSLVQQSNKRWRGSALYSVNDLGHGYTWDGPKIVRIRCMFPDIPQKELTRGLFPAFWSYGTENLIWRTSNRIEIDYFEFDGQNGKWLNGLSTHYHYPYFKGDSNIFARNTNSYNRFKVYGGELTEEKSKIPGGLYFWDGKFHTWEFVMDRDMTYINVTIVDEQGRDQWVEVCRCPTAPIYLERIDLQFNYALKASHGKPKDGERQDFVVDWIEVLQRSDEIAKVPEPFTGRPSLSGTNTAGSTITCDPNLVGIRDIRYFWFSDGYPLTWGPRNHFTLGEAEAGTEIRCLVKAVGALDQPEAWSSPLK
tara:strand:- start:310 stop:2718 length:2409 start_codon:yes stop_codon:yes gene_type:complete